MYRWTEHPTAGRTSASLFLGSELQTRLSLLCLNVGEKVMDSQAKQKAHMMCTRQWLSVVDRGRKWLY